MSIPYELPAKQTQSLIESSDTPNQSAQAVCNPDGSSIGSGGGSSVLWEIDSSTAFESSSVIKSSPGRIRKFSGRIDSTAPNGTYYLQLINATSVPADGTITLLTAPVKLRHSTTNVDDTPIILEFPENGLTADFGLVWVLSTTEFNKTISGNYISADVFFI